MVQEAATHSTFTTKLLSPGARRLLAFSPLLLSLLFVAAVIAWAERADRAERAERQAALIAATLSVEAQLRAAVETETARLEALAAALPAEPEAPASLLAAQPELNLGLARLWQSVTWLDDKSRVLAIQARPGQPQAASSHELTLHLRAAHGGGQLLARYAPAELLQRRVFWWLAEEYDIALVTGLGQVIASTGDARRPARGEDYAHDFGPNPDVRVRLTRRAPLAHWYRGLPVVLASGLVLLMLGSTVLLRQQVALASRAEVASRTEAAWRRAMEESALVGLRARDASGRLLYANQTFCTLVGYPLEQLLGVSPPMPYWPPESLEELLLRNQRNLTGHAPREGYETRWRHQSGRAIDVMVFESPLVDAQGNQIGWMGSIVDITEQKRLAERERRQMDTLAHHARLTLLGEMASSLAHELNQPLSAIVSYNAGILTALSKRQPEEPALVHATRELGKHAALAGRIVHRVRERVARREPKPELCDVNQVLQEALDLLRSQLKRADVSLSLQLARELPEVRADRVGIEQVVSNLLRNALDALSTQRAARNITIESALCQDGPTRAVCVAISDNGSGLGGRSIEALTAPFCSDKPQGMGMGLAICRSIMEAHRGTLTAADAPSGGARFSFSLPAVIGPEAGGATT
jgi:two-component system, LuxR family, sensor histidine kinase DctS